MNQEQESRPVIIPPRPPPRIALALCGPSQTATSSPNRRRLVSCLLQWTVADGCGEETVDCSHQEGPQKTCPRRIAGIYLPRHTGLANLPNRRVRRLAILCTGTEPGRRSPLDRRCAGSRRGCRSAPGVSSLHLPLRAASCFDRRSCNVFESGRGVRASHSRLKRCAPPIPVSCVPQPQQPPETFAEALTPALSWPKAWFSEPGASLAELGDDSHCCVATRLAW